MTIAISELCKVIERFAPLQLQESYDNAGLIIGNPQAIVTGILISLDCTEEVLEEAMQKKCNVVVCHHPIVFSGLKKITGKNYVERTVIKAIKNDIAIYAAHTNLDNVLKGVNNKIADKIGLVNRKILNPLPGGLLKLVTFCPAKQAGKVRAALFEAGAGMIGNYSECSFNIRGMGTFKAGMGADPYVGKIGEPHTEEEERIEVIFPAGVQSELVKQLLSAHPYEEVAYDIYALNNPNPYMGAGLVGELESPEAENEFLKRLKTVFKAGCIRYTHLLNKSVKKVAVCGGSGSFLLQNAIKTGADIFITGDFKYHQFFDADKRILIADIGHYESEQFTGELFYELLTKSFTTFAVRLSETCTNPINYL